jgi:hypothetical protein
MGLTFEAWLASFGESAAARSMYARVLAADRQRAAGIAAAQVPRPARHSSGRRASQAGFAIAGVVARVPNSVFALGGMGAVASMATEASADLAADSRDRSGLAKDAAARPEKLSPLAFK